VHDGIIINQNSLITNQNGLNDGASSYETTFNYDGGIYSRREREFLGFTRIETRSPARSEDDIALNSGEQLRYTATIVDYSKPESNDFQKRVEFEYLNDIPTANFVVAYTLDHGLSGDPEKYRANNKTHLTQATYNTYTYYAIGQTTATGLNMANISSPLNPANLNLGEAACIFPAITKTETVTFLVPGDPNYYAYLNTFEYDPYMNVTVAVDGGLSKATLATWPKVDEVEVPDGQPIDVFGIECIPQYFGPVIALMDYFPPGQAAYQTNMLQQHRVYVTNTSTSQNLRRKSVVDALNATFLAPATLSQWKEDNPTTVSTSDIAYDMYGNVKLVTGPPNDNGERQNLEYTYETTHHQYITNVSNSYGEQTCMDYNYATATPKYTIDPNGYAMYFTYDLADRVESVFAPREYADATTPYTLNFSYHPKGIDEESINITQRVPVAITRHYLGESATATPQAGCTATAPGQRQQPDDADLLHTATFIDGLGRVIQVKKDASRYNTTTQQNERVREVSGMTTYDWQGMTTQETLSWIEDLSPTTSFSVVPELGILNLNPASILTNLHNPSQPSLLKPALAAVYEYDLLNRIKTLYPATATSPANANIINQGIYKISTHYAWDDTYDGITRFRQEVVDNQHGQTTHALKLFNSKSAVVKTITLGNQTTSEPDIVTQFTYDPLGQLTETTNPLGLKTTYSYDWFGRAFYEKHPDRGETTSKFDKAGNVTQITTPSGSVSMQYHYNRLTQKDVGGTPMLDRVSYTYGTATDGKNARGRIVKIEQGSQTDNRVLTEHYKYDELGQVAQQTKTIAIPLVGEMNFTTKYKYDSWGRLQHLTYPDLEEVAYTYAQAGGELESVKSIRNFGQINVYDYVTQIGYDGYGNQQYMLYGNNVETVTEYSEYNRALDWVKIASPHSGGTPDLLNKAITYKANGNISHITNTANSFGQGWNDLGGTYTNTYFYDYANRLHQAKHEYDGQTNGANAVNYQLNLTYNVAGGIKTKTQAVTAGTGSNPAMAYNLAYNYLPQNGKDSHKLASINHSGTVENYTYDTRGNVTQIANHPQHGTQQFIWDEADRLMAVQNNAGLHHYVYDHTGTRLLKGSYTEGVINVNGQSQGNGIFTPAPYTVYTGPHMVCTFYADAVDVTKHYYTGVQRVASKLYQTPYAMDCPTEAPSDPENPEPAGYKTEPQPTSNYIWCQQPVTSEYDLVLQAFQEYVLPDVPNASVNPNPQLPAATPSELGSIAYAPCEELDWQNFNPEQQYEGGNLPYIDCLCRNNPQLALERGIDCQSYTEIYWYHPDYLGNTEFVTDAGGYPYQFFYYSAFGESLVQQDANTGSFATPYKFNAKEQDPETGNYYYGARYYNPQTSIWFGVDPLSNHPNQIDKSPFAFTWNNPIMLVDPDGRCPECEEKYKNPTIGLIHESSGGQVYQYLETRDENGVVNGAAWTGLGEELDEVQVSPFIGPSLTNESTSSAKGSRNFLDYAGLTSGWASTYNGVRGDAVHNGLYWIQKNGTIRLTSTIKSNITFKKSYELVGKVTSMSKMTSAGFAGLGTVISAVQFYNNPTKANAFDAAMGLTSFIPVVGWAISGTYFVANLGSLIFTDQTLGQHLFGDSKIY
jgi:RHS repeat-associated protein